MPTNDSSIGLAGDLTSAIDDLQASLHRASEATAAIRALVPRVAAVGTLFEELDAVIRAGRQQVGATPGADQAATVYSRPTLVVPSAPQSVTAAEPAQTNTVAVPSPNSGKGDTRAGTQAKSAETLICFRLEFESNPGPLDLRTVDDAVSEHPDVRDVALLDYDGRKATLKVWIVATAKPVQVQESLTERASQLFGASNDVSVVALEDVA